MALIYYGPQKKRINRTKPNEAETNRCFYTKRNAICISHSAKGQIKEMTVPEHVVDLMKNMNPQQLVNFLLLDDDDWHVKTSSGNASGS